MNKAIIIGNLTRDPELRTTASGISVCTFTVAVSRPHNRDETDFIPVVTWRKTAENCSRFLAKGRKVGVDGRIQVRNYEDNNGRRRYVTEIVADNVEFLSPRGGGATRDLPPEQDPDIKETGDIEHVFGGSCSSPPGSLYGDEQSDFEPLDEEQMPF